MGQSRLLSASSPNGCKATEKLQKALTNPLCWTTTTTTYTGDSDDIGFRFFLTTKNLVTHLNVASNHADATYKQIWQGFPVLIIGTTDQDRHFHELGLAVCTNERAEDFEFIFNAIKKASELYCGKPFNPNVLVCDAAKAIHNGFRQVFGEEEERSKNSRL